MARWKKHLNFPSKRTWSFCLELFTSWEDNAPGNWFSYCFFCLNHHMQIASFSIRCQGKLYLYWVVQVLSDLQPRALTSSVRSSTFFHYYWQQLVNQSCVSCTSIQILFPVFLPYERICGQQKIMTKLMIRAKNNLF